MEVNLWQKKQSLKNSSKNKEHSAKVIDPNGKASSKDGIYGLPFKESEAKVVYLPIPWDVTTSYQAGTSTGPQAILKASEQIDFFDLDTIDAYKAGLFMKKESAKIKSMNKIGRPLAKKIINSDDATVAKSKTLQATLKKVNQLRPCHERRSLYRSQNSSISK